MEQRRLILIVALVIVSFFLYKAWQQDHPKKSVQTAASTTQTQQPASPIGFPKESAPSEGNANTIAKTHDSAKAVSINAAIAANSQKSGQQIITVKTDVLRAKIDLHGGTVIFSSLPKYPLTTETPDQPVVLFNDSDKYKYLAQSALVGRDQKQLTELPLFKSSQKSYQLANGDKELKVDLTRTTKDGVDITKTLTFKRGSYDIDVAYHINNQSGKPWKGNIYNQLIRKDTPLGSKGVFHVSSYFGASMSTQDKPYNKISFKDMSKENTDVTTTGGWIAMQQHYFLSAWIPNQQQKNRFYTRDLGEGIYAVGSISSSINVAPNESTTVSNQLYVGPAIGSVLNNIAPHLGLTVDYGWLWFISIAIFWLMQKIYLVVGNWGVAIILVTFLIKLVFYKLSATSYRSMANMRKLQPKIESIKERYGDDKQKLSQATMELYRKEKVNPLGGCLPILIQIPFFIALYWVLIESVELRQAPFIFWIHDLSVKDPWHVLPIIMGATMFIQQKLNPPPPDPTQAKIFMLLPIVFTAIFWSFPAGLVLYWIVNNSLSILQQWYIMRKVEKQGSRKSYKKKTAKT